MTGYSPQGCAIEYFSIKKELLEKLRNKIKILQQKRKKTIKKYRKIQNYVTDLHWKTINDLVVGYDKILLPEFESQKLLGNNRDESS